MDNRDQDGHEHGAEQLPAANTAPTLAELQRRVATFRDDRDWLQFHRPKDLAAAIVIEAAELLEQFQWRTDAEVTADLADPARRRAVEDEIADVLLLLLSTVDVLDVDLLAAASRKLRENEAKYPVEKSRGNATKYTNL